MGTVQIRGVRGGPFAKKSGIVEVTPKMLAQLGACIVGILCKESRTYFGKRGWSGKDPMGGPAIWDSFSFQIRGKSTLDIMSSFYGMNELARGDIPGRRMTWLTQDAKDRYPSHYALTDRERDLKMKLGGRVSKGKRLPLIVPVTGPGGSVIFRIAPIKTANAWIHPGIAKFTFFENALRKARVKCAEMLGIEAVRAMVGGV